MATRSAVRVLRAGAQIRLQGLAALPVPSAAHTSPLTTPVFLVHSPLWSSMSSSVRRRFSSVTHTTPRSLYSQPSWGLRLSAPRRAGQHALEHHHEAPQIVPRYTDDIPAEYYQYGAFKNFRNDSSLMPNIVRAGAVFSITLALCLLNVKWSCEHWHYKHRLAGSYLESE